MTEKIIFEPCSINPFPNPPFWDRPKFKEAADNNWNMTTNPFPNDKF